MSVGTIGGWRMDRQLSKTIVKWMDAKDAEHRHTLWKATMLWTNFSSCSEVKYTTLLRNSGEFMDLNVEVSATDRSYAFSVF